MMGLWEFLSSLFEAGDAAPREHRPAAKERRESLANHSSRHSVHTASVTYVGPKFAKVAWDGGKGVVFLGEMSTSHVRAATDVLAEGDQVEVVVLGPSEKRPDEDIVSITAVAEARSRRSLAQLAPGGRIRTEVSLVEANRVSVTRGLAQGYVDRSEWDHETPASLVGLANVGDSLELEVLEISAPAGWERNRSARCACFKASRRRALPKRSARLVNVSLAALPFDVEVRLAMPPEFDPVVRFVFEALASKMNSATIEASTGLPPEAVSLISEELARLELIDPSGAITRKGKRASDAIRRLNDFSAFALGGLFVSAAPMSQALLSADRSAAQARPPGSPPLPSSRKREDAFMRATEEELDDFPFADFAPAQAMERLRAALADPLLRVFIRRSRQRPLTAAELQVEDAWLLATLWNAFDPAEARHPFRPEPGVASSPAILLVRLRMKARRVEDPGPQRRTLMWDQATDTLWHIPEQRRARVVEHKEGGPELPQAVLERARVASGMCPDASVSTSWVTVVTDG